MDSPLIRCGECCAPRDLVWHQQRFFVQLGVSSPNNWANLLKTLIDLHLDSEIKQDI